MADITVREYHGRVYVKSGNDAVAIMERSPWTGEFCYGLYQGFFEVNNSGYREHHYRPAFQPTRFKTAKAAAKVAVAEYYKQS